jgi:hypothetical protein
MSKSVIALVCLIFAAVPVLAGPMTIGERQRLVAHLEMTEAWVDSETLGLSPAQLKFKMTPDSWSVEEVMMHLAIAEPQYWQSLKERARQYLTASQDLYQWFLMISTHSQRHILQIREVKAHRNFPKK